MKIRQSAREWQHRSPTFQVAIAHAREERMQSWAYEIIDLTDDATADNIIHMDTTQGQVAQLNATSLQWSKLRIRTRHCLMARIAPAL